MLANSFWFSILAMVFVGFYTVDSQTDRPVEAYLNNVANLTDLSDNDTSGTRSVPTLQFVIVVTRHGNRSPLFTFPASQYHSNDSSVWPYGAGELTQSGRVQMYKLGEKFRSLYDEFLDRTYRMEDFHASSSLASRAMQSAELFLAGLYPPSGSQVWNQQLLWQPVPVYPNFLDHGEVTLRNMEHLSPSFKKIQELSMMEFEKEHNFSLNSIIDYALPYTGINVNHVLKSLGSFYREKIAMIIWESLDYPTENGFPLPGWSAKIYPEPLKSLAAKITWTITAGSFDQIKYSEGELFQEMVGLLHAKASHWLSPDRRMVYYSGHDYTIITLLSMLGQPERYVNTGSALIYELHRHPSSGHHYVKVLYMDGKSPDLEHEDINIPGCDSPCDLHLLLNITEKYYNISD